MIPSPAICLALVHGIYDILNQYFCVFLNSVHFCFADNIVNLMVLAMLTHDSCMIVTRIVEVLSV